MKKLVLLAFASLPLSVLAQGGLPDKPYIYVEGKAEIEKRADMATLHFELVARNPDQGKANQEVQAKANQIFALLKERKIAEDDVVASDINSEPQFEEKQKYNRKRSKIIGYAVTRSFSVKVREVQAFAKLVDELLAITGLQFSGIDTRLIREREVREELFEKALTNARERAKKTLQPMAMKIDSVFAVSPVPFPQISSRMLETGERVIVTGSYVPTGEPAPSQYRLDPVTVSVSVHILYLISPATSELPH